MSDPEEKKFYEVFKYGVYYFPASKHYGGPVEVGCDRCLREDIATCLGWGEVDLCMECVADINKKYEDDELSVYSDEN
jgi:hypothetical protein